MARDDFHSVGAVRASLRESFERAWRGIGARDVHGSGNDLLAALLAAWSEPHRRYHTPQHLQECLRLFDAARHLAVRPAEVEIALWFHDAVYDTARADNERRSADWARTAGACGGVAPDVVARIESLVMVTRHSGVPADADEQLLVDIDLAILGASEARFAEYGQQIRDEYAHVPEALFRDKRRAILTAFLARDRLYGTRHFHDRLEAAARANLARAAGGASTAPPEA